MEFKERGAVSRENNTEGKDAGASLAMLLAQSVKTDDIDRVSPHEDQSDVLGADNKT